MFNNKNEQLAHTSSSMGNSQKQDANGTNPTRQAQTV
jgi:hypothetical protein